MRNPICTPLPDPPGNAAVVRTEGFFTLYNGFVPALLLTTHGAVQFVVYEKMKEALSHETRHPETVKLAISSGAAVWVEWGNEVQGGAAMAMGVLSKIAASTVTYPEQVVKARLQQKGGKGERYSGMVDCFVKTWRAEGLRGFFRGIVPNTLRIAPSGAVVMGCYESVANLLRYVDKSERCRL